MEEKKLLHPVKLIIYIYVICYLFRVVEYMFIRTDQSIFGEAFIHKLVGIFVLGLTIRYLYIKWSEIGFSSKSIDKNIFFGLLLGLTVYMLAYGIEFIIYLIGGNNPLLKLYVTSYAIQGNQGKQTGLLFFSFCIIGNIINVFMEEGVFRGLFIKLGNMRYTFIKATILSSIFFGIWHIAAPVRNLLDGEISVIGAVMSALMLVITSGITGAKFCLLTKITGSLWMPMADHFLNNTIVNILHIEAVSGVDEFQVIRISIAQTLSFLIVLFIYWKSGAHYKETFRI